MEPEWIVNDMGELGVKIGSRFFFLYKGGNLEYGKDGGADGVVTHEDGTLMKYRIVGKREFGETCHPIRFVEQGRYAPYPYTDEIIYTPGLSSGTQEDVMWKPIPC